MVFDAVLCNQVLERVEEISRVSSLLDLARVLKPRRLVHAYWECPISSIVAPIRVAFAASAGTAGN